MLLDAWLRVPQRVLFEFFLGVRVPATGAVGEILRGNTIGERGGGRDSSLPLPPPSHQREGWGERRCKKGREWKQKTGTRGEKIKREGKGKEG